MKVFIDFESAYDSEYSLKKMPTMQYIRDPRWECLGAALAIPAAGVYGYYDEQTLREIFARLPWERVEIISHKVQFDGAVLTQRFGHIPDRYSCSQNAAQYAISQGWLPADSGTSVDALAPRYGLVKGDTRQAVDAGGQTLTDYALVDLEVCKRVYDEFYKRLPNLEKDLIDLHAQMACEPVLELDESLLHPLLEGPPAWQVTLRSKPKFAQALRALGVEPETKTSPTTGKQDYAFAKKDPFMLALHTHTDPRVRKLVQLREDAASNQTRTRAQRFLDVGSPFPVPLKYYGAHTGRASGSDSLNLQNLGRGSPLRAALRAPEGYMLVICDLAQIEVRVLAWRAVCARLLSAFRKGEDPYIAFAQVLYGVQDISSEQRRVAKAAVLALGFGQGPTGFITYCANFGIPMNMALSAHTVDTYRRLHPEIVQFWDAAYRPTVEFGYNPLLSGRRLSYPDMTQVGREIMYERPLVFSKKRKKQRDKVKLWPGLVTENEIQALARDVVMWQTVQLSKSWRVALSVHDEAVLCVPEAQAEEAMRDALHWFSQVPEWAEGLPTKGEAVISPHYGAKP